MKLFDTHCHLDMLSPIKADGNIDSVIRAANDAGVDRFVCIGVNLDTLPHMLKLIEGYPDIRASAGLHPCGHARQEPTVEELIAAASARQIVAVGETGLDYHYDKVTPEIQRERFARHIKAACALNKPLIIHTRDAREDTIRLLREHRAERCGGVMHCFTESVAMAEEAMALGFYISISGIVTFRNADNVREIARAIPADRLLIETDAPYLAPVPMRGKENQPAYVRHVAEYLAELRGESLEKLIATTRSNGLRLFNMQ